MSHPAAALILGSFAAAAAKEVVTLTSANFDAHIREHTKTLVMFHAPWCGHCKKLAPEFEDAAQQLKGKASVKLATLDATAHRDVAENHNIKGYPTVKWFEEGVSHDFDGGRTAEGIAGWVTERTGPAVVETNHPAEPREVANVVLYAENLSPGFHEAARSNRKKAAWYWVKRTGNPRIALQHKGEAPLEFQGSFAANQISAFLKANTFPLFGKLDGDSWDRYMESGKGLVWSMFDQHGGDVEGVLSKHRDTMTAVASTFRDKYAVTYTDTVKFREALDSVLGVTKFPCIAVQLKPAARRAYAHFGELTEAAITQFIRDAEAGKLEPLLKTEEVPTSDGSAVVQVVGKTFKQEVFDAQKDVVVHVHAPWCGQCKKFAPEYKKLAEKVKGEGYGDLLKLTSMDGTLNDSPVDEIEWSGFPTVYFVKAGQKEAQVYDGERTAKALWKYIKKRSTHAEAIKERIEKNAAAAQKSYEL